MKQECLHVNSLTSAIKAPARSSFDPIAFLNPTVILNLALIGLCAVGLAYYVSSANSRASAEYQLTSLRSQTAHLMEEQSTLSSDKSLAENPAAAAEFARANSMVSAQDIFYVFENGNVALQR